MYKLNKSGFLTEYVLRGVYLTKKKNKKMKKTKYGLFTITKTLQYRKT